MAYTSTAAVLDAMATRIAALTPSTQASAEDLFRVQVGHRSSLTGSRAMLLQAQGAIRKPGSNRSCDAWITTVEVTGYYADVPTEQGSPTVYQTALRDAEDVLADLYVWAADTDGIHRIDPAAAEVGADEGTGELIATRQIAIEYQRG